jgi:hypothetical protein
MLRLFLLACATSIALASDGRAQGPATPPSAGPTTINAIAPADTLPRGGALCVDASGDGRCDDAGEPLACPSTAAAVKGPSEPCDRRPSPCSDANRSGRCDASTSRDAARSETLFGAIGRSIAAWFTERKGGDQDGSGGRVRRH